MVCHAEDTGFTGSVPGLGRSPGGGKWQPTLVFLPGESHGQRSLVGYSPKGRKESDTTERLSMQTLNWEMLVLEKYLSGLWPLYLGCLFCSVEFEDFSLYSGC